MADNVSITAGSGTTIGADDIGSVQYQRIKLIHGPDGTNDGDVAKANPLPATQAGDNLAVGQVSVGTTATSIASSRTARRNITVVNHGTTDVILGGSGVTTSTGLLLPGIKGASATLTTTGALYGIVGSGTQTVSYAETY